MSSEILDNLNSQGVKVLGSILRILVPANSELKSDLSEVPCELEHEQKKKIERQNSIISL